MEYVSCIAKTSFVNQWIGSVTERQRFTVQRGIAEEFEAMGLVTIEGAPAKKLATPQQSNLSPKPQVDGKAQQSVLLPAETVSPTSSSPLRGRGRPSKTGK